MLHGVCWWIGQVEYCGVSKLGSVTHSVKYSELWTYELFNNLQNDSLNDSIHDSWWYFMIREFGFESYESYQPYFSQVQVQDRFAITVRTTELRYY